MVNFGLILKPAQVVGSYLLHMMHSVTFAFLAAHMMTIVTLSVGKHCSIFLNTYTDTDSVDIFDSKVQVLTDLRLATVRFIYLFATIPSMNLKLKSCCTWQ